MAGDYLKQRRDGWYFQIAVPRSLRGRGPWGSAPTIIRTLKTRDRARARDKARRLAAEHKEAFDRAAGDIPLTRAEINEQAWLIYQDALKELDLRAPEPSAMEAAVETIEEALDDPDFNVTTGSLDGAPDGQRCVATDDIATVAKRTGAVIAPRTETWRLLAEAVLRARLAALRGRLKALQDEPSEPPATFVPGGIDPLTLQPLVPARRPRARASAGGMTVSEASERYIAELQRDAGAKLTEQTRGQHEAVFRLFEQFTKDAPLAAVDRSTASDFLDTVAKLDPHWGRSSKTKDLPLDQLLRDFGRGDGQLSNRTLNRYVSSLSGLYKWARRRGHYDGVNPFSEQSRTTGTAGWLPYTPAELNRLFGAPVFRETPREQRIRPEADGFESALLWVPLIALHSGMRLGEICQLRHDDVRQEGGVTYFNVAEESEGQSLKTEAAVRMVPVHDMLARCGFLDYRDALAAKDWLFPGLKPGGPDGKRMWYFARAFTTFRRKTGIDRPRVSFHSLRKNFTTALDNAGVPQSDVAALIGHKRGFTYDVYSGGLMLARLQGIVAKVDYPALDLKHLQA